MRSPEPSPRIARPPARCEAVKASCASIAGWRRIVSVTHTPTLMRFVAAPAAPIISSGSKYWCGLAWTFASAVRSSVHTESGVHPIRWHGHQIASKPSASALTASSTALAAGGMIRPGAPTVTRIGAIGRVYPETYQPSGRYCYASPTMLTYRTDGAIAYALLDR